MPSVYTQSLALASSSALSSFEQSCSIVTAKPAQVCLEDEQILRLRISSARDRSMMLLLRIKEVLSKFRSGSLNVLQVPVPVSYNINSMLSEIGSEHATERAGSVSVH